MSKEPTEHVAALNRARLHSVQGARGDFLVALNEVHLASGVTVRHLRLRFPSAPWVSESAVTKGLLRSQRAYVLFPGEGLAVQPTLCVFWRRIPFVGVKAFSFSILILFYLYGSIHIYNITAVFCLVAALTSVLVFM